jgi:hypothetical protein
MSALLRTFNLCCHLDRMKTYWLVVLAITLADSAFVTVLLVKDGGPEGLVWWAFLIVPLLIVALVVGLVLLAVR